LGTVDAVTAFMETRNLVPASASSLIHRVWSGSALERIWLQPRVKTSLAQFQSWLQNVWPHNYVHSGVFAEQRRRLWVKMAWMVGSGRRQVQRMTEAGRQRVIRGCLKLADYLQGTQPQATAPQLAAYFPVEHVPGARLDTNTLPHAPIPPPIAAVNAPKASRFGHSPPPRVSLSLTPSWNPVYELGDDEFDEIDDEPTTVYNPIPTPFNETHAHQHHAR